MNHIQLAILHGTNGSNSCPFQILTLKFTLTCNSSCNLNISVEQPIRTRYLNTVPNLYSSSRDVAQYNIPDHVTTIFLNKIVARQAKNSLF